jgi:hypothetical protein
VKKRLTSISFFLSLTVFFLTGCNGVQVGGTGNNLLSLNGDKNKVETEKQKAGQTTSTSAQPEEVRLANERAKIAEDRANLEADKRKFAEQRLDALSSKQKSKPTSDSQNDGQTNQTRAPRRSSQVSPKRSCCPTQSTYIPKQYYRPPPVVNSSPNPSTVSAQPVTPSVPAKSSSYTRNSEPVSEYSVTSPSRKAPVYSQPSQDDDSPRKKKSWLRRGLGKIGGGFKAIGRGLKKIF